MEPKNSTLSSLPDLSSVQDLMINADFSGAETSILPSAETIEKAQKIAETVSTATKAVKTVTSAVKGAQRVAAKFSRGRH